MTLIIARSAFTSALANQSIGKKQKRPKWLIATDAEGMRWTISGGVAPDRDVSEVSFDIALPDGSRLSNPRHHRLLVTAMTYAIHYRVRHPAATSQTHVTRIRDLLKFMFWAKLNRVYHLDRLTRDHMDRFVDDLSWGSEIALQIPHRVIKRISRLLQDGDYPDLMPRYVHQIDRAAILEGIGPNECFSYPHTRNVLDWFDQNIWVSEDWMKPEDVLKKAGVRPARGTWRALASALLPVEELFLWRNELLGENIPFFPFPTGASMAARRHGVETERTPTIPPRLAFKYLGIAVKWVLEIAPLILSYRSGDLLDEEIEVALRSRGISLQVKPSDWCMVSADRKTVSCEGLERLLSAACFAVIAGLTLRRIEEIRDLSVGCIQESDDGVAWMTIWIEKTLRRHETMPVPLLVKKSIEVLESLSEKARKDTGSDSIWMLTRGDEAGDKPAEKYINQLAALGGPLDDEWAGAWNFSPHQFRRFGAMLYFWRYEEADLGVLSYHLRHFNLEMTRRYVTDPEAKQIFAEIAGLYRADVLRKIVHGETPIGGAGGLRLKAMVGKLIDRMREVVDVVLPEMLVEKLLRTASRLGIEFKQHVWGTICACPAATKFSSQARCKGNQAHGPDFANANEHTCGQCPFAISTNRFCRSTADLRDHLSKAIGDDDTLFSSLGKVQLQSLSEAIAIGDVSPLIISDANS